MFTTYLELGYDHILDLDAYDHILFVITLCAIYAASHWKRVLILVTAFTLGHSVTLALSTLNILTINPTLVEVLIPVTIILTAIYNVTTVKKNLYNMTWHYALAAFFGLIHGLGFSNYLKAILGREESIFVPLLSFNLGVEVGQIVIVLITIAVAHLFMDFLKLKQKYWTIIISLISILVSSFLLYNVVNG